MKLRNKFTFIFLCCLSIAVCNAGNILARMFPTQEQRQRQLNDKLLIAAERGDLPKVQQAIADGADVHFWNDEALQLAVWYGHLAVVKFLIEHGANIHALDDYALRNAAQEGHWPIVQYLVEHGANIHANNDEALQWAVYRHWAIVRFLLDHGADIHAENDYALRRAVYKGHWVVAAYLLQHGADRTKLPEWPQRELQHALRTSAQVHAYIFAELQVALHNHDQHAIQQVLNIIPVQELPQNLLLNMLQALLHNNDWPAVDQLLNILPQLRLPNDINKQITQLVVHGVVEQLIKINKTKKNLPLNVQDQILSHLVGSTAARLFIAQRNKALSLPGETHETV